MEPNPHEAPRETGQATPEADDEDDGLQIGWPVAMLLNSVAIVGVVVLLARLVGWLFG
jgi:hypothetical protein